jgi:hypothetical protein
MNNTNANTNDDELDEELGDFQLPLSLTPRTSSSTGHGMMTSHFMQPRSSTSSLQHNVVLHSNINDSSSPAGNRFELNLLLDKEDRISSRRQTNSLMTVHEQDPSSDLITDDSWHLRSPTSTSDVSHPQTNDDKTSVCHRDPGLF